MIWGGAFTLVIDRISRKKLMLTGALGQGICFAVTAASLGVGTQVSNAVAVTCIFLYHVCFVSWKISGFGDAS